MPSAYVIVNSTVTNPDHDEEYKKWSCAARQGAAIMRIVIAEGVRHLVDF
jgi:uncharacterized protein (DUF1330 family)